MVSFRPDVISCFMLIGFYFSLPGSLKHAKNLYGPKALKLSEKPGVKWPFFPLLKIQLLVRHPQHSLETLEINFRTFSH